MAFPKGMRKSAPMFLLKATDGGLRATAANRFKPIYIDRFEQGILNPVTNIEVLRETPTTLVYDAHNGMGMVASHSMMEKLIKKAKTYGMAAGATVTPVITVLRVIGQ